MTYPNQPPWPQQPFPPQGPPPAYGYPPQGQQQWAPPQAPAAPQTPAAPAGTLDSFYSQPSGGAGKPWAFGVGQTRVGIVAREITNSDVQAQTIKGTNQPATYRDGRQKFVLVVPMLQQPDQEYPDGRAGWYVKGQTRDELARAMAEAGVPTDMKTPEANAVVQITCTGERQIAGLNPQKLFAIKYTRPEGAAQQLASAPSEPAAAPTPPVTPQAPQAPAQAAPVWTPPAQAPAAPQGAPTPPPDVTSEQAELLARLGAAGAKG